MVERDAQVLRCKVADLPAQHLEQDDEDRHLDEHGKAASERIEARLLVDLHRLFLNLLLVTCVQGLNLLQLGLHLLHVVARFELLALQREEGEANDEGHDDDRKAPVTNQVRELS